MPNTDWIEVKGPASLADLVAAIDPSAPSPEGQQFVTLDVGGDEWVKVQYDPVDADTWPYMITVQSRSEDIGPVRAQATRIFDRLKARGWELQLTSAADDGVVMRSPVPA